MKSNALTKDRQKTHGDFHDTARAYYALRSAWGLEIERRMDRLGGGAGFSPGQIYAIDMIFAKLARIVSGDPNHPDHWDDIAGYAWLGGHGVVAGHGDPGDAA